jgi:hypothetical protein
VERSLFDSLPEIRHDQLPTPWSVRMGPTGQAWIIAANGLPVVNAAPELARRIVAAQNAYEAPLIIPIEAVDQIRAAWNGEAQRHGFIALKVLTPEREKKLKQRVRDVGGVAQVIEAIERIGRSRFLRGLNDRRWKASFDWFLQKESFARLLDGKYDNASDHNGADRAEAFLDQLSTGAGNGDDYSGATGSPRIHQRADHPEDAGALRTPRQLEKPERR